MKRLALPLVVASALTSPAFADVLFSTDFEGLTLEAFSSPTETGKGDGTDWTSSLPAGWSMSYSGPLGNPVEFQGWRVMDVDSWIATEGNQDRATWTRGGVGSRGSVLVADGDAYDDGTNIDTGLYNTFALTPAVDLAGIVPGSVRIALDSFWRNEVTQKGRVEVSYDGGNTFETLKFYDSAALGDGVVVDERLDLAVNNPGSGTMVFRLSYTEASNDWWWAVDNVAVTGSVVPEPSTIALGALGVAALAWVRRRR